MRRNIAVTLIFIIIFLLYLPLLVFAFYEWKGEEGSANIRGFIQLGGAVNKNPARHFIYQDEVDESRWGAARLLMLADMGKRLSFEFNAYQSFVSTTAETAQGLSPMDTERSAALEWNDGDTPNRKAHLTIDRLNIRLSLDRIDITMGRQPVNLATCFYFTPNDFFAPFSAQTFYRVYKPGVDTIRAEVRLGGLSQLSILNVFGYRQDTASVNGWSRDPLEERSSKLGRISTSKFGFEWAVLGGTVRNKSVVGGSLQGEVAEWLGIRGEGHYSISRDSREEAFAEATLGMEHRFENSLNIRVEQFYHGGGYGSVRDYDISAAGRQSSGLYLGRNYTALGAGYDFTALFRGEAVSIANWTDSSYLLSFYSVYSVSDEAEFSAGLSIPIGSSPKAYAIESEFGLYPYVFSIEYRTYF